MKIIIKYVAFVFIIALAITVIIVTTLNGANAASAHMYTLKEYNGKVAVYKYGDDKPSEVLDVYLESLTDYDRKQLVDGINVDSDEQLLSLIEDFDG